MSETSPFPTSTRTETTQLALAPGLPEEQDIYSNYLPAPEMPVEPEKARRFGKIARRAGALLLGVSAFVSATPNSLDEPMAQERFTNAVADDSPDRYRQFMNPVPEAEETLKAETERVLSWEEDLYNKSEAKLSKVRYGYIPDGEEEKSGDTNNPEDGVRVVRSWSEAQKDMLEKDLAGEFYGSVFSNGIKFNIHSGGLNDSDRNFDFDAKAFDVLVTKTIMTASKLSSPYKTSIKQLMKSADKNMVIDVVIVPDENLCIRGEWDAARGVMYNSKLKKIEGEDPQRCLLAVQNSSGTMEGGASGMSNRENYTPGKIARNQLIAVTNTSSSSVKDRDNVMDYNGILAHELTHVLAGATSLNGSVEMPEEHRSFVIPVDQAIKKWMAKPTTSLSSVTAIKFS